MYNDGLSPADVAVLSGNNGGNNGGFGNGDWSAWIIIFLIFALGGFGRNGFGGGNGGNDGWGGYGWNPCCSPATAQGVSDEFNFNQLDNGIRGVQNGLCDGFYAINSSISGLGYQLLNCCLKFVGNLIRNNKQAVIA